MRASLHCVTNPPPPTPLGSSRLLVHCIPMMRDNLGWLLVDPASGDAALVDGTDATCVLDYCRTHSFKLTTILNTHTHPDHIGVNRELAQRGLLASVRVFGPSPETTPVPVPGLTDIVDEGDVFSFADAEFTTLRTEGHLAGHVSYVVEDALFCGDIIFGCGCGRVFTGPAESLFASLVRLCAFPPETRVYCAHEYTTANISFALGLDPQNPALIARAASAQAIRAAGGCTIPTTIGLELATNPFIRTATPAVQRAVAEALPDQPTGTPVEVFVGARLLRNAFKHAGV